MRSELCELLNIKYPIMQGAFQWLATPELAAAVSNAGGLGTISASLYHSKEELLERGMNQSAIHEDVMIGAEDSEITGKCRDGRTVTLFQNGVWAL